ncbi:hypothetical protein J8L88_05595 [Aquimarina sp. MMG015]|uniref:hypothetical protein n=1 Tax=Aquimarina sp. MMG015 TaxID=2822689 RepID=UPI001B39F48D|nr:hypothetical protein [Aquimarina sp. MMG015]MBQ4802323.1 hypothetical protein [Aquimarina sp. MMG015]
MKTITFKLIYCAFFFLITLNISAQEEGYNEIYQLKKINNELKKYHDNNQETKYFYELMSIKNDTLRVKKFSYPVPHSTKVWDELYVPMKEIEIKSIKYKKGILIKSKGKKKIIGDYTDKRPNAKKYYGFKIHPHASEEIDKEIMEMIKKLFQNHQ